jgi:hypothetical protein
LEHKLAHEYWSSLKYDIVRRGLVQNERLFLWLVLENNPNLSWQNVGFMPFDGVSSPPVINRVLSQITTVEFEKEAMEALGYVDLLNKLQISISHVQDKDDQDMLRLFHRCYAKAFGTPCRRG